MCHLLVLPAEDFTMPTTKSSCKLLTFSFLLLSPSLAWPDPGMHQESEAGIVITSGNTQTSTYNLKEHATYQWATHLVKFNALYLSTMNADTLSARSWTLGLRYEEALDDRFSLYAAEDVEADTFSGYFQRYNTDLGGKYFITKETELTWFAEAGYRFTRENRVVGTENDKNFLRAYTEAVKSINKNVSGKLWVEYLPNIANFGDYRFNLEPSLSALLNDVFSVKAGYLIRYTSQPLPGVGFETDTTFTLALVAKI